MKLTPATIKIIQDAYYHTGIPSDRLPHSSQLRQIAVLAGIAEQAVFNFLLRARNPRHTNQAIASTHDRTRLPRLDPNHCELFETNFTEAEIKAAERIVYGAKFLAFALANTYRTPNAWATDLIRYRKTLRGKTLRVITNPPYAVKAEVEVIAPVSGTIVTGPTTGYIIALVPDGIAYFGAAPTPPKCEFVAAITEQQLREFHRQFRSDQVCANFYRLQPQYVRDLVAALPAELETAAA